MLNPCKAKIWFVVELCEPILPSAIELANFELFSSTPKELQIQGSDKYPTTEWQLLGSFVAADSRDLQRFPVRVQQPGNFVKFIRVDLHSYYGSEHYCPFSLIRAFGVSLAEEFDTIENGGGSSSPLVPDPTPSPVPDLVLGNESVASGTNAFIPDSASGPDGLIARVPKRQRKNQDDCKLEELLFGPPSVPSSCEAVTRATSAFPHHQPIPSPTPTQVQGQAPGVLMMMGESLLSPTPVLQASSFFVSDTDGVTGIATPTSDLSGTLAAATHAPPNDQSALTPESVLVSADAMPASPTSQTSLNHNNNPDSSASSVSPAAAAVAPSPAEPPVVPVTLMPVPQGPAHVMNESSIGSVIAASSSKESIFIRLNNRIKALELNMSLNREAIESLTRRQAMFEHQLTDILNKSQAREEEGQRLVLDLQLRLTDISEQVYLLVAEKEVFHWQLIQVHILLMVIEIALIIMIMSSYMKNMMRTMASVTSESQAVVRMPSSHLNDCQHLHLHQKHEEEREKPLLPPISPAVGMVSPPLPLTPRSSLKVRSTPEKSGIHVEHHPLTGSVLFKKKRNRNNKRKNKRKGLAPASEDQENRQPESGSVFSGLEIEI